MESGTLSPGREKTPWPMGAVRLLDGRVEAGLGRVRGRKSVGVAAWVASRGGDLVPVLILGVVAVRERKKSLPVIAAVGVQALAVNYGVKRLTGRSRPCGGGHTSSFPSGHTATAAAVSVIAGPHPVMLSASALITAAGRLLRGVHWLSDVVVGGAVGTAYGLVMRRVLDRGTAA